MRRKRMLEELDADIREHIERETQDNIERGMSPEEARYAAHRKFGNVTRVKEETRMVWSFVWLEQIIEDIRFGLRLLRKNPGFTAVAILTLALGIGANTAVFSLVYAVLLRPLPFKDPSSLIVLNETTPKVGTVSVSYPNFLDWRSQSHAFSQMAAVHSVDFNLGGVDQPENISGDAVSPNFLLISSRAPREAVRPRWRTKSCSPTRRRSARRSISPSSANPPSKCCDISNSTRSSTRPS